MLSHRLAASAVVAWLGELISQTCAEPPTVVGISLGGAVAARFAIEFGDQTTVRRLVLVNSGGLGRARPAPGALVALIRYSIHRTSANFDRQRTQVSQERGEVGVEVRRLDTSRDHNKRPI